MSKVYTITIALSERFWNNVAFIPFHECWEWVGSKNVDGYGRLSIGHTEKVYAHRISLLLDNQKLMPSLVVDHTCRNKGCVNPKHLRQVTLRTNFIENNPGSQSAINRSKTHCPNGHSYDYIRPKYGWRMCSICAKKYNLGRSEYFRNYQREKRKRASQ